MNMVAQTGRIKCVSEVCGQYISVDIEYNYRTYGHTVYYQRDNGFTGSSMPMWAFKKAIENGSIVIIK